MLLTLRARRDSGEEQQNWGNVNPDDDGSGAVAGGRFHWRRGRLISEQLWLGKAARRSSWLVLAEERWSCEQEKGTPGEGERQTGRGAWEKIHRDRVEESWAFLKYQLVENHAGVPISAHGEQVEQN